MDPKDITINRQLELVSAIAEDCQRHQATLATLSQQIAELKQVRDARLREIEQQNTAQLRSELQRIQADCEREFDTLGMDSDLRSESLRSNRDQQVAKLTTELKEQIRECEERRDSEMWMLQSVMDDEADDSPATHFEREVETFHTQKAFLDERFGQLQEQLDQTGEYLARCHSAMESTLPESTLRSGKRLELRDLAVEAGDKVLVESEAIERLHLPHWIKGMRLWGFSLLAFLILWVVVTAIKADLREFVNADLANPDWEWAGVAALIAAAVVALFSFIVTYNIQNKLRTRFTDVLQHVSNAEKARSVWEDKTQKYLDKLESRAAEWRREVEERRAQQSAKIKTEIDHRIAESQNLVAGQVSKLDADLDRQLQQFSRELATTREQIDSRRRINVEKTEQRFAEELKSAEVQCEAEFQRTSAGQQTQLKQLLAAWNHRISELRDITQSSTALAAATLRWPSTQTSWELPNAMPDCISVGDVLVTAPKAPESDAEIGSTNLCVEFPAVLQFPENTSILVEHDSAGRETALSFLRTQILRLLTVIPAGRIRLTLIDPVGLGQSFSAMMHLADFDELLIHSRIWTDSSQIRDQLQKVTEHMENIFQTYLRSQFDTIEEYNASAGEVAEPYHFVVVAGFPTAFTDEGARHLASILTSGPRCGVHALIAWNPAIATPPSFDIDDLTNNCIRFQVVKEAVQPVQTFSRSVVFEHFPEPAAEEYVKLVRDAGEQSKDARRGEVSFNRIAPRDAEIWSHSTADGIDFPIGRAGAARLQYMRLGRGTSQHVLVAGKTGSGKSTLLHILITNLALHYSPDEIQFYLIDFKKGVEFRTYAVNQLPHARVVAIESDREFGLSVLERLDQILQERGELFRERGVQDVPSFREQFPAQPMPRLLLLIDEFQEFFVAEDRVSARASLLLDRLVRQGRAFGIHVMLGSQTLGGAYSLARSTMGQIAVRVALQCSESDAHLILSEDNSAARLLSRPGEAIYNDANGLVQGNHQFQIAWLDEERREQAIQTMLAQTTSRDYGMVVFEGNVPPTAELCSPMNAYLKHSEDATRAASDSTMIWLGEPVAIAAPTAIELKRASGQNMLIVGQDEAQVDSILAHTILSGYCGTVSTEQSTPRITLLHDMRDEDSQQRFSDLQTSLGQTSFTTIGPNECDAVVSQLYGEVVAREESAELSTAPEKVFVVRNVGQFRALRKDEDDFGLGGFGEPKEATTTSMFSDIIKRGPLVGIHVVVWSDTFSNAVRWLSASLLREFETRIAFRMNQTDSASLIDSPIASSLGPGRALVYRDQTGTTEKFRPFAWPSQSWLSSLVAPEQPPQNDFDIDTLTIE